jgi:hypothetical protein
MGDVDVACKFVGKHILSDLVSIAELDLCLMFSQDRVTCRCTDYRPESPR